MDKEVTNSQATKGPPNVHTSTPRENANTSDDSTSHSKERLILVGLPNAGKSTIFNLLTGGHRKVSNYSGITVDVGTGPLVTNTDDNKSYEVTDLPGLYNLNPSSFDEGLTLSYLLKLKKNFTYQKVIIVVDWQRLASSLGLALSILDVIKEDALIVINKDDSHEVDAQKRTLLEEQLGVPVLPLSAIEGDLSTLDHFIRHSTTKESKETNRHFTEAPLVLTTMANSFIQYDLGVKLPYEVYAGEEGEKKVAASINDHLKKARQFLNKDKLRENEKNAEMSEKIDRLALHPLFGGIIFIAVFYLLFSSIYTWAAPAMDFTEGIVLALGDFIGQSLPEGLLKSLIVDGIFAGVGGVVIFLPQIMILFFLMSLLEQSGYISRAALIVDRIMSWFGLGGKAFLPYLSGYACAIPGIMAARTIPNPKERYATIMTLPLITCSARLPVYILLVGTFVPSYEVAGLLNSQALAFFFLYFLGSLAALVIAKVLRLSYFKGESSQFIMDLPRFQRPSLRVALYQSWLKGRSFLKKAGTIILGLSLVIWLLSTFPRTSPEKLTGLSENQVAALELENSALGRIGHAMEPVIRPLGMDWKIGVGLLVSFGARELFVSAMGTLYAVGDADENSKGLKEKLKSDVDEVTGKPLFSMATAWSILMFFVFGLQCTSTLAILKKESGSWKIPLISFGYMFVLAYTASFIAYKILS